MAAASAGKATAATRHKTTILLSQYGYIDGFS